MTSPTDESSHRSRAMCARCDKPAALCLCDSIPQVPNSTGIIIVQHRHERSHALGTARIASLALERVEMHVVGGPEPMSLNRSIEIPENTGVLYPTDDAIELRDLPPHAHPDHLLLLDGTWAQARSMYRSNQWLRRLPHFRLQPTTPSRYRIRKAREAHHLSTVESIAMALRHLEPKLSGLDEMVSVLDRMVDEQIASHEDRPDSPRRKRTRQRVSRSVPAALSQNPERIVVVYGEFLQRLSSTDSRVRETFQWTAARLQSEETFEGFVRPTAWPTDIHLNHMGLSAIQASEAEDVHTLVERWRRFLRPHDVLASWDGSTLAMQREWPPPHSATVHLKDVYANVRPGRSGSLQDVLERETIPSADVAVRGRAAQRLGHGLAVARWLRDQGEQRAQQ